MLPVQITFHGIEASDALAEHIRKHAQRVARLSGSILRCRVAVERPHHHHRQGDPSRISVELTIPGRELVEHASGDDAYATVGHAFDAVRRQLIAAQSRRSGRARAVHTEPRTIRGR
jgi:ribosomal subunit interface protein